jgi:AAA+ ATPase superfamily predicted ATPase
MDPVDFPAFIAHPFRCLTSGPSSSGKTWLIKRVIAERECVFADVIPRRIVYVYSAIQPRLFDEIKQSVTDKDELVFLEGYKDLDSYIPPGNEVPSLVSTLFSSSLFTYSLFIIFLSYLARV